MERIYITFYFQKKKSLREVKRQVYQPVLYMLLVGYCLVVIFSVYEFLFQRKEISLPYLVVGLILFFCGAVLRIKAISDLEEDWSLAIKITLHQHLVTSGVYKRFSHPYHLSVFLELSGFCLISNAFGTIWFLLGYQLPIILLRIYYEEKILSKKFGLSYEKYKQSIWYNF